MDSSLHKASFLGPKGENADELERLLLEVLHDHVFWRRNFHPSDPRLVGERDKRAPEYDEMTARLRDELFQILAELKRAAPLYSPRQIAHIVSDPTLPALVGYFAGLLYNQNNVVAEVSPETVREEREYFRALAQMVSYPPFLPKTLSPDARAERRSYSWGHLCSGGTIANLEALWMARNVRLYPLAVRLLAHREPNFASIRDWPVTRANGDEAPLGALSTFQLANLPNRAITDLHLRIKAALDEADRATAQAFQEALPSVRQTGLAAFLLRYNEAFPDDRARLPKVFISQAAHYCWKKNMDLVGLGANALDTVPVDRHIRIDMDALADKVRACAAENQPVLGVISILGTTEEGAIDPLHQIEAFRQEVAHDGIRFWHHCDAAFGGFFAAMLPKNDDGTFRSVDQVDRTFAGPEGLIDEAAYRGIAAIAETDSLTIDPHKFGYVPYPAGAVLCRNYHVRDAISYAAPYLSDDDRSGFGGFLGQWTLEGSRPGAAAVSCYLSQAMVPLTEDGHGQFMKHCIEVNKDLVGALTDRFTGDATWITLRPFAPAETVGYCFVLTPRDGLSSIAELNDFTNRIWRRMTVDGREDINQYDFLLSKTEVGVADYRHVLDALFPDAVLEHAANEETPLVLLRTCLMNPFLHDWNARSPSFSEQFVDYLHEVALEEYLEHVIPPVQPMPDGGRLRVLVVEPSPGAPDALTQQLRTHDSVAARLNVRTITPADLHAADELPAAAQKVVIRADAFDGNALREAIHRLHAEANLAAHRVILLGTNLPPDVSEAARAAGIPTTNVLLDAEAGRRLERLLPRLYTPLNLGAAPS